MTEAKKKEVVDEVLARLRTSTEGIAPPPGLADRLAANATTPRRASFADVVLLHGRGAVLLASLAAAASIVLALQVERAAEQSISHAAEAWWAP